MVGETCVALPEKCNISILSAYPTDSFETIFWTLHEDDGTQKGFLINNLSSVDFNYALSTLYELRYKDLFGVMRHSRMSRMLSSSNFLWKPQFISRPRHETFSLFVWSESALPVFNLKEFKTKEIEGSFWCIFSHLFLCRWKNLEKQIPFPILFPIKIPTLRLWERGVRSQGKDLR